VGQEAYELFWGDRSRAGRGRPSGLNRERIVAEAVAIADAEGLHKVSMKHLAERLGSGVMSLYRHVPGKDELLLLMYDSLMTGPLELPEGDTRRELMLGWGRGVKDMFTSHPWALQVATANRPMGPNEAAWLDGMLARMDAVDMPAELGMIAILTIDFFVIGAVRPEIDGSEASDEFFRFLADPAVNSRFPHLARLATPGFQTEPPLKDHFEFGLKLVVDGLEHHIESSR
jgi:AcrR family transcriptional regulator